MLRRFDRLFLSPRFAVLLLGGVALISIVGTVPPARFAAWPGGAALAAFVERIGADPAHLYWTRWYAGLLLLVAGLMLYVTGRRWPVIRRGLTMLPEAALWRQDGLLLTHRVALPDSQTSSAGPRVAFLLRQRNYRRRTAERRDGREIQTFDKGAAGVLGPPLVHVGFAIVVLGGAITRAFGSVEDIWIAEGEAYEAPGAPVTIRLEKFAIIQHPGHREPEEYVSTLAIVDAAGQPRWHQLRVNQPLVLRKLKLFQMRYRPEVRMAHLSLFAPDGTPRGTLAVPPGTPVTVPGTDWVIHVLELAPDAAVDAGGRVGSRSPYFVNPAAHLEIAQSGFQAEPVWRGWAFRGMFPAHPDEAAPLIPVLDRVAVRYHSGIKVVRDPGVGLAYFGFLLLVVGAFVSSYLYRRFVRLEWSVADDGPARELNIAGLPLKHAPDFRREWQRLVRQVDGVLRG